MFLKRFLRAFKYCAIAFGVVGVVLGNLSLAGFLAEKYDLPNLWTALIVFALFAIQGCFVYAWFSPTGTQDGQ